MNVKNIRHEQQAVCGMLLSLYREKLERRTHSVVYIGTLGFELLTPQCPREQGKNFDEVWSKLQKRK